MLLIRIFPGLAATKVFPYYAFGLKKRWQIAFEIKKRVCDALKRLKGQILARY
jgi:hypothetical protein